MAARWYSPASRIRSGLEFAGEMGGEAEVDGGSCWKFCGCRRWERSWAGASASWGDSGCEGVDDLGDAVRADRLEVGDSTAVAESGLVVGSVSECINKRHVKIEVQHRCLCLVRCSF